ncbi:DUF6768 family protein [Wenzhouxiangella sediminis]|uniref:DUF4282 domain-containing protein n=1 Tax=Wenzhouxiangella sediminis TaxID=1792836 RepID=A0A3E1K6Z8_9GAMM|nr:DUF6768 family protein [Wenzhouxiangella sediminis]RFF29810.1 hypothetical protein DZC52_10190 [Wenzhouxiangella sediminis]
MSKIDDLIQESLSERDEALMAELNREPGYFKQAFGLFRGKLGWVMWVVMSGQLIVFVAAVFTLWSLFHAQDPVEAIQSGVIAVILVQIMTFLRGFMGDHFEANRVLREIARLELRLISQRDEPSPEDR